MTALLSSLTKLPPLTERRGLQAPKAPEQPLEAGPPQSTEPGAKNTQPQKHPYNMLKTPQNTGHLATKTQGENQAPKNQAGVLP